MSGDTQILRQYLVSLGFKVDESTSRKFDSVLGSTNFKAAALVTTLVGIGTATVAAVNQFARGMEQMYYAGRRAESTVGSLQALEFAAKTIGISGGDMRAAIEGMAKAIRTNPGIGEYLQSLGIVATGTRTKDMVALVKQLSTLPHWLGSMIAGMFNIPEDTYFMMTQPGALDKLEEMAKLREKMAKDAGIDADAVARASVAYGNQLDIVKEKISLLKDALLLDMIDPFTKFLQDFGDGITRLTRHITRRGVVGTASDALGSVTQKPPEKDEPWLRWAIGGPAYDTVAKWMPGDSFASGVANDKVIQDMSGPEQSNSWTRGEQKSRAYTDQLKKWGAGVMSWMVPSAGAAPASPRASAPGALGGENWSEMLYNDIKNGAIFNSPEVQEYVMNQTNPKLGVDPRAGSGGPVVNMNQKTDIHITAGDAEGAGRSVSRAQTETAKEMANVVRNNIGNPR